MKDNVEVWMVDCGALVWVRELASRVFSVRSQYDGIDMELIMEFSFCRLIGCALVDKGDAFLWTTVRSNTPRGLLLYSTNSSAKDRVYQSLPLARPNSSTSSSQEERWSACLGGSSWWQSPVPPEACTLSKVSGDLVSICVPY